MALAVAIPIRFTEFGQDRCAEPLWLKKVLPPPILDVRSLERAAWKSYTYSVDGIEPWKPLPIVTTFYNPIAEYEAIQDG
jgi:hypothetical protein